MRYDIGTHPMGEQGVVMRWGLVLVVSLGLWCGGPLGCGHTVAYDLTKADQPRSPLPLPLSIGVRPIAVTAKLPAAGSVTRAGLTWRTNQGSGYRGTLTHDITEAVVRHLRHLGVFSQVDSLRRVPRGGADLILEARVAEWEAFKEDGRGTPTALQLGLTSSSSTLATAFGLAGYTLSAGGAQGDSSSTNQRPVWVVAKVALSDCRLVDPNTGASVWQGEHRGAVMRRVRDVGPSAYDYADLALKRAVDRLATDVHTNAIRFNAAR